MTTRPPILPAAEVFQGLVPEVGRACATIALSDRDRTPQPDR